jgi:NTP pyrophosphatase (non-canonical NTP hydrolase)
VTWLTEFAETARTTDQFIGRDDHLALLAAGLLGEAGSVVTELKKEKREREAYPAYRRRMLEEIGDFVWYFVRITSTIDSALVRELEVLTGPPVAQIDSVGLALFLEFGAKAGSVVSSLTSVDLSERRRDTRCRLCRCGNGKLEFSMVTEYFESFATTVEDG